MKQRDLRPEFIEFVPPTLEEGVLYVSMSYASAIHKCCCGCGEKVVTPLSPTDWKLTFDGETISLYPSIGNWDFRCQSHYWIRENRIEWAPRWTEAQIRSAKSFDESAKKNFYEKKKLSTETPQHKGIWQALKNWAGW
jgi:hypothetical protein